MAEDNPEEETKRCRAMEFTNKSSLIRSICMHIEKDADSPYQAEHWCKKLMPIINEPDHSQAILSEIKCELGRAVMLRQLGKCRFWNQQLTRFLAAYSLKFSKEDHITFIKLMYELLTIPNLKLSHVQAHARTLYLLIEKTQLISPKELQLEWRPLWDLMQRLMSTDKYKDYIAGKKICGGMYKIVMIVQSTVFFARFYFPVTATQEILDEVRPLLYVFQQRTLKTALETLCFFLPPRVSPENHQIGWKLWFEELMTFWEVCHNNAACEYWLMLLVAPLAFYNIGYIDWEPHIPIMFARFVKVFNLPVQQNQRSAPSRFPVEPSVIAMWIVSTLGGGSSTQKYMEKFLKTIETFVLSINRGPWCLVLEEFLIELTRAFIYRLQRERVKFDSWETPTPDSHKLTDADVDAFVNALSPFAITGAFNRTDNGSALQHLASLRPSLVVPEVLKRMNSMVDSVTEPQKLSAAMVAMTAIAPAMVQRPENVDKGYAYTEARNDIIPLLSNFVRCFHPNEIDRCFKVCDLVAAYASLIPIVDSSRCPTGDDDNQLNSELCESTWRLGDFVLDFLEHLLDLIDFYNNDYATQESLDRNSKGDRLDRRLRTFVTIACSALLARMSDDIFASALSKLRVFFTGRILETEVSKSIASAILSLFAMTNGSKTLRALLPHVEDTIMELATEDELEKEANIDKGLLYGIVLLDSIVQTPGENILPHAETITRIIHKVLECKDADALQCVNRVLRNVFGALGEARIAGYRSNGRDCNDNQYQYVKDWGLGVDPEHVEITWYKPGEREIGMLQELFTRFVVPEIKRIDEYADGKIEMTRPELRRSLFILQGALLGCTQLLPIPEDATTDPKNHVDSWPSFLESIGIHAEIRMPDGSNVIRHITNVMTKFQERILTVSDDDKNSLYHVATIWNILLLGTESRSQWRQFVDSKISNKNMLACERRWWSPVYLLARVECHQDRHSTPLYRKFLEIHKEMILRVCELATSRYAMVRIKAQRCLYSTFVEFCKSYQVILEPILDILKKDPEENHEAFKGVFYILKYMMVYLANRSPSWKFTRSLLPAVVLSKPTEKLSVIRLSQYVTKELMATFEPISIAVQVPDSCVQAAASLWDGASKPKGPRPSDQEVRDGAMALEKLGESNAKMYDGLVSELLAAILNENTHMRHRTLGMEFLRDLVHPNRPFPIDVTRYFLDNLVHECLKERVIATHVVAKLLRLNKRKAVVLEVDPSEFAIESHPRIRSPSAWYPGVRLDNVFLQYSSLQPNSQEDFEQRKFIRKPNLGYYTWPKKIQVYAPFSQQLELNSTSRAPSEFDREVERFFSNPDNLDKFFEYNCCGAMPEGSHLNFFYKNRVELVKLLGRNYGETYVSLFLTRLESLVRETTANHQIFAYHVIDALIKGSKHWSFASVSNLSTSLSPLIVAAIRNMDEKASSEWSEGLRGSRGSWEPCRNRWLLELLADTNYLDDSSSVSLQKNRLALLGKNLEEHAWRLVELEERLRDWLEKRALASPFDMIRGQLGNLLLWIHQADRGFPGEESDGLTLRARDFLDRVVPRLRLVENATTGSFGVTLLDPSSNEIGKVDLESLRSSGGVKVNPENLRSSGNEDNLESLSEIKANLEILSGINANLENLCRIKANLEKLRSTGVEVDFENLRSNVVKDPLEKLSSGVFDVNLEKVRPIGMQVGLLKAPKSVVELHMEIGTSTGNDEVNMEASNENNLEQEVEQRAARLFNILCVWIERCASRQSYGYWEHFYQLFEIACHLVGPKVDPSLRMSSWQTLKLLSKFAPKRCMGVALEAVERVSRSSSVSARATCLGFLEGFVFWNMAVLVSEPRWVDSVREIALRMIEDEIIEVRIMAGHLLGGLLHCNFIEKKTALLEELKAKASKKIDGRDGIRIRHAAILGLCAFIDAHPYDVPEYVPTVIEHLDRHSNDSQTITATIGKTLSNFKRTHYTDWANHASKFTEDQLAILQDMAIPPSYFA